MTTTNNLVLLPTFGNEQHEELMRLLDKATTAADEIGATSAVVLLLGPRQCVQLVAGDDYIRLCGLLEVAKSACLRRATESEEVYAPTT